MCKYALMTCALMAAGCAQQPSSPLVVKVQDGTLHAEQNRGIGTADMIKVAEEVLAGMHFTIEKADVQSGLIRTRPLSGAQFFEFWRSDNVGADNTLAANLHTIRRTVTINIRSEFGVLSSAERSTQHAARDRELRIDCNVQVQRLSLPERQVSSSARVYGIFSLSSPSLQRLKLNPEQKKEMAWIDLDRDSQLEAEILKRIQALVLRAAYCVLPNTEQ